MQNVFTDRRAYVNALTYQLETETSASGKKSKQQDIDEYKKEKATVEFPDGHKQEYNFHELEETYNSLKDQRTKLSAELGDVLKPVTEASNKMSSFVSDHMVDLTPTQIDGLKKKTEEWDPKIVQINVADANIVDRCESCHMNAREPLRITAAVMTPKGEKKPDEYAHALHQPSRAGIVEDARSRQVRLLALPPGQWPRDHQHRKSSRQLRALAVAVVSETERRSRMPDLPRRRYASRGGDVGAHISNGKFLFRQRGCMGCHRYEGYDKEPEDLNSIAQQMKLFEQQKIDNAKISADLMKQADTASSNDEANRFNQQAVALRVANSKIDGQVQQLDFQTHSLMQDVKKIGPNLKDVRLKLNRDWIPVWLKKPSDFRPTTKMPNFRLTDHQIQTISAYLWQAGFTDALPKQKPGNAEHGQQLFETRGCLACHSIGEGDQTQGGTFAANLTRVGEKANYDYLVRWIHNARERTRPYCPYEKKDIGPEDYAKKGLPYQFDLQHSQCPNDGHELQVQNMTVMPSLRLSPEDAADIATYLMSQKKQEPSVVCPGFLHGRS